MDSIAIFPEHVWEFWGIRINSDTLLFTWVALAFLVLICFGMRWVVFNRPDSMIAYLVKRYVTLFVTNITTAFGRPDEQVIAFFVTLATFIFICNALVLIPPCEEPTRDINSTFAFSIATFLFVQYYALRAHGAIEFIQEYFKMPLAVRGVYPRWSIGAVVGILLRSLVNLCVGIALFPMELLGKLSGVLSLAFRLFGNILSGSVISMLWLYVRSGSWLWQIIGVVTGLNMIIALFFGLFESVIQAGVFTMIGISYLARAVQPEE